MRLIRNIDTIYADIQTAKKGTIQYITNFFPVKDKLKLWIDQETFYSKGTGSSVFFLRKEANFFHLYFCSDVDLLSEALNNFSAEVKATLVVDLIGRQGEVNNLTSIFEKAKFSSYKLLLRMVRIDQKSENIVKKVTETEFTKDNDALIVHNILKTKFDSYAEQIPSLEEIQNASKYNNIITIKINNQMAGFLFFEMTGYTSVIRYWFVADKFRQHGIGSKLMNAYFSESKQAKRHLLWVISDNDTAVQKYHHYGFTDDNLIDHVMVKKGID
jgi:ribosomal protein S18 acetylase RimI-like enzyme